MAGRSRWRCAVLCLCIAFLFFSFGCAGIGIQPGSPVKITELERRVLDLEELMVILQASGVGATAKIRAFKYAYGGTDNTYMDYIDGNELTVGDIAIVIGATNTDTFELDNSGCSEDTSIPDCIAPDTNPGSLRWRHRKISDDSLDLATDITGLVKCDGSGDCSQAVSNTDYAAATHASRHEPNGADPVGVWYWGGDMSVSAGVGTVVSGYIYTLNETTTTITNFTVSGGASAGDTFMLLHNDPDVTIDFSDNSNIEGNVNTDMDGHATQIWPIVFTYADSRWNTSCCGGMTDGVTMSVKLLRNHNTFSGTDSIDTGEAYNYTHYITATGTISMPAVGVDMEFCLENHTDADVYLDPNGSEVIRLNGQALTGGYRVLGTDYGDICCCEYYAASTWSCMCSGYEDAGS